jgi:hypothetical protein
VVEGAPRALGAGAERFRLWRSVSWTPGAEGAPRVAGVVVVVVLAGVMRRDWLVGEGVSFGRGCGGCGGCLRETYHDCGAWVVAFVAAGLMGGLFLVVMA